jgi:hypothetical protein
MRGRGWEASLSARCPIDLKGCFLWLVALGGLELQFSTLYGCALEIGRHIKKRECARRKTGPIPCCIEEAKPETNPEILIGTTSYELMR